MNLAPPSDMLLHQGFFHLRTPLLSSRLFEEWQTAPDKTEFLLKQLEAPLIREAIYVASPSLYERLTEWEKARDQKPTGLALQIGGVSFNAPGANFKNDDKFLSALARYVARAAYRCTPFGLFSTVSVGRIGAENDFDGIPNAPIERHVQYDAWIEQSVLSKAIDDPEVRQTLRYSPNATIVDLGGQYYYTEMRRTPSRGRFIVSRIRKNEGVALALATAANGALIGDLAATVARDCEVDIDDAAAFIVELIDNQFLVPDLAIPLIGGQRLQGLHAELESRGQTRHTKDLASLLVGIREKARTMPEASLLSDFREANKVFSAMDFGTNGRDCLFQVDSRRNFVPRLGQDLVDDIRLSAQAYFEFSRYRVTNLDEHKKLFSERFGDREVPLELALHSEIGIPFPTQTKSISDLLDGIYLRNSSGEQQAWIDLVRTQILAKHVTQSLRAGKTSITLTDANIEQVRQSTPRQKALPSGIFALATLIGDGNGELRFLLQQTSGRSGTEIFGRFTSLDPQLCEEVCKMLRQEEDADPERIYAEINHDCGGRVNNINVRARLRAYEILCLASSSLERDQQIPTSDLLLRLDQGQYRLRSRRLNREVVPRMTTVHNYTQGTHGIYHFLCMLQWQDADPCAPFSWPQAFDTMSFLPRVCYRNSIWAAARWRFDRSDAVALAQAAHSAETLTAWRNTHGLPRFVTLDVADNSLPVDLDNPLLARMLLEEVEKSPKWELAESLTLNHPATAGRQYSKEIVVPFVLRRADALLPKTSLPHLPASDGHRPGVFLPGADWSYVKVYSGALQAENLLLDTIAPLLNRAYQDGLINSWFFLRYADPEQHLRVRFHSTIAANRQHVTDALMTALTPAIHNYQCSKLSIDTYEQELDRYGGASAMPLVESLFHHDSMLAAQLLALLRDENIPVERWVVILLGIENWLQGFSLSNDSALHLMTKIRDSFKEEFSIGAAQKVQLGTKFRGYRRVIDSHFFSAEAPATSQAVLALLRDALPGRRAIVDKLRALEQDGALQLPVDHILSSFVHMFCNRMLEANPRQHEAVLYDFMVRILMSKQSRKAEHMD